MKMKLKSNVRLNQAIEILIAYEAYCISKGYVHVSFAEALYNKKAASEVKYYYNMLNRKRSRGITVTCEKDKCVVDIIRKMKYVNSRQHLACAFITLNIYLRDLFNKTCILSWYDMHTLISEVSNCVPNYAVVADGNCTVKYTVASGSYEEVINMVITNSIYNFSEIRRWVTQDCPLSPIALWLLSNGDMISGKGIIATALDSDCGFLRDNVVFTKLLRGDDYGKFERCARKYKYDYLDKAAALLYSLPILSAKMYTIDRMSTIRSIRKLIDDTDPYTVYSNKDLSLSYGENRRIVCTKDFIAMVSFNEDVDMIVMTAVTSSNAYTINIDARKLIGFKNQYKTNKSFLKTVGETIDCIFKYDEGVTIENLIDKLSNGYPSNTVEETIHNFI